MRQWEEVNWLRTYIMPDSGLTYFIFNFFLFLYNFKLGKVERILKKRFYPNSPIFKCIVTFTGFMYVYACVYTHVYLLLNYLRALWKHCSSLSQILQCIFPEKFILLHCHSTISKIMKSNFDTTLLTNPRFLFKLSQMPQ